ncbi:hypothetical protein PIB30_070777 [Stylosanthes scabra]|uniref:Uncharacterized protein n=1 Tax=Stylosanthes scabra TaxID=79078 RepID=A0ABU6QNM3_9FABA|nr:hypothetical protein [Stylosanthes scabra]
MVGTQTHTNTMALEFGISAETIGFSGFFQHYSPPPSGGHNLHTGAPIDAPFAATRSSHHPLHFYATFEVLWAWLDAMEGLDGDMASLGCKRSDGYERLCLVAQMERWNRVCTFELGIQTSQGIDSSSSESTLMRATSILTISKLYESTLKGSRVDSKLDRDDFSFETLQGVDSEWPESTPAFKMSFKEA